MEVIYLLIPIAIVLVTLGVWAFLWAVKNHQFDDLEGPAHQILFDDDQESREQPASPAPKDASEKKDA